VQSAVFAVGLPRRVSDGIAKRARHGIWPIGQLGRDSGDLLCTRIVQRNHLGSNRFRHGGGQPAVGRYR
jgi:hypothetical protein